MVQTVAPAASPAAVGRGDLKAGLQEPLELLGALVVVLHIGLGLVVDRQHTVDEREAAVAVVLTRVPDDDLLQPAFRASLPRSSIVIAASASASGLKYTFVKNAE
ncbi:hypothetical protein Pflav_039390 [Phytohabitans flavus]|uniref:Uncharacterized protein n=1 Tax=Phytohabitans flavus TaxID=1076124 RepID=A0A6F8XUQ9_9ACTN|nr:hypothetical protein Pflav_039390 [Phytohabitans flavus]